MCIPDSDLDYQLLLPKRKVFTVNINDSKNVLHPSSFKNKIQLLDQLNLS